MKRRLQTSVLIITLVVVATRVHGADRDETPELSYTPANLIAHSVARLKRNQCNLVEIRLGGFKLFGFDSDNALLTGNFEAIGRDSRNVPQVYALVLRTSDGGLTWTQVLDTVERRISYVTDVKFIGRRGLLLYEHSMAGNSFGFLYSQNLGETWIDSELEGITGSFYLVDWSVRHPHQGIAVIRSDSGIPIEGDVHRETDYWVVKTMGGFRWRIVKTIQRGEDVDFDPTSIAWPSEWDPLDSSWILDSMDGASVAFRIEENTKKREVLSLPNGVIWAANGADIGLQCEY